MKKMILVCKRMLIYEVFGIHNVYNTNIYQLLGKKVRLTKKLVNKIIFIKPLCHHCGNPTVGYWYITDYRSNTGFGIKLTPEKTARMIVTKNKKFTALDDFTKEDILDQIEVRERIPIPI